MTFTRYDDLGRKTEIIYPDGSKDINSPEDNPLYTTIEHHLNKNQRTVIDAEGNEATEVKDWSGNVIKVIKGLEKDVITTIKYDNLGNKVQVTDPEGRVTQYKYNSLGQLVEEILPEDEFVRPVESADWDNPGSINTQIYQPRKLYFYDDGGRKIKEISPDSEWLYGSMETNPAVYSYQYNAAGNLVKEADPENNTVKHFYDRNGNEVKTVDPEGNIVQKMYTARGKVKAEAVINGLLENSQDVSAETGDNDLIKYYQYNIIGKKIAETSPQGVRPTDSSGDNTITLFADEIYEYTDTPYYQIDSKYTSNIEYDYLYRKEKVIKPDLTEIEYEYDKVGNKTTEINGRNKETIYNYNSQNQLEQIIDAKNNITTYSYDPEGNLMKKELPNGITTRYVYNILGQKVREIRPEGDVIKYSYDGAGNLSEKIDRKNQRISYSYRRDYQLTAEKYYDQDEQLLQTKEFNYDRNGNRLEAVRTNDGSTSTIHTEYDPLDRIKAENRTINGKTYTTAYRYDKARNMTGIKNPSSDTYLEYNYNKNNQLVGINGIADGTANDSAFSYTDSGFLTKLEYNNGTITEITPDQNTRIERITVQAREDGVDSTVYDTGFDYDGNNNLTEKTNNITGYINNYSYDNLDRLIDSDIEGTFYGERSGINGIAEEDFYTFSGLTLSNSENAEDHIKADLDHVKLDFVGDSVGAVLVDQAEVGKIELIPAAGITEHRLTEDTISVHFSMDKSLTGLMAYTYKDNIPKNKIITQKYFMKPSWKLQNKIFGRKPTYPKDGGKDWLYVNQLE